MAITRIEGENGEKLKVYPDGSIDVNVASIDMSNTKISIDGLKTTASWEGSVTETVLVSGNGLTVVNDGTENLTVTVNSLNVTVKPDEVFSEMFELFTQVKISTTGPYRALVKG